MTKENRSIKPTPSTDEKKSLLFQIVTFPKHIGQLAFDIIKYSDASGYAKMMVGYGITVVFILVLVGIIAPDVLKSFLRFLFPE